MMIISNLLITNDNNFLIATSADNTIIIWNILKKREEIKWFEHEDRIRKIIISKDNKYFVSGYSNGTIKI